MDESIGTMEQDLDLDSLSGFKRYQERLLTRESSASRDARVWRRYLAIDAIVTSVLAFIFFIWAVVNSGLGKSVENRLSFDLGIVFFAMLLVVGMFGVYVAYAPNVNRTRVYLVGNIVAHLGIAAAGAITIARGALNNRDRYLVYGSIACSVWVVNLLVSARIAHRLHAVLMRGELLHYRSRSGGSSGSGRSFSNEAMEDSGGSGGLSAQDEMRMP